MTDYFVSGWCGFKTLFSLPESFCFRLPFIDETDVFDKKAGNLVCWSTGANFALKHGCSGFKRVILVSPFLNFTEHTPERILKRMIKKFESLPEDVIKDFMNACGIDRYLIPEDADLKKLAEGLNYLLDSGGEVKINNPDVVILHGENDAVVNIAAGEKLAGLIGCRFVRIKNHGHFIPSDLILEHLK